MPAVTATPATESILAALHENASALRAFVRARVPAADVDDVLQLAAMRAFERASSLEAPDRALAWLYRVHRNVVVDVARKGASERRLVDRVASRPKQCTSPAEQACSCSVYQAKGMKGSYAEILQLVDLGDLTVSEAAEALGVSTNNATVRLHRARKALRHRLLEHCGVTSLRDCISCRCVDDGCCTD